MNKTFQLDEHYSTTRNVTREKPLLVKQSEDKFETVLFLPECEGRQGEGGLRTQGYFKDGLGGKPLFTIVTVVYNGEQFLEETILSVINQTYDNVEYIIIDGGSNDGTLNIIRKYERLIDYWVSEKDSGIYDAMNKGISLSKGELVGLINADDFYDLNAIELVSESFIESEADIIFGTKRLINEELDLYRDIVIEAPSSLESVLLHSVHPTVFVKKAVYERMNFCLDYRVSADYKFMLDSYLSGVTFCKIPKVLACMRMGGISSQLNKDVVQLKFLYFGRFQGVIFAVRYYARFYINYLIKKILPNILIKKIQRIRGFNDVQQVESD
jgi:glycosyltransferase involved in cell wall biosynthesis